MLETFVFLLFLLASHSNTLTTVILCTQGNFHALLLFKTDEELEKVGRLVHNMVERAQRMDGTATGEHGVGVGKRVRLSPLLRLSFL